MFLDFKNKKLEFVKHEILSPKSDHLIVMLHEGLGSVKMWRDFPETLANKLKISTLCFLDLTMVILIFMKHHIILILCIKKLNYWL